MSAREAYPVLVAFGHCRSPLCYIKPKFTQPVARPAVEPGEQLSRPPRDCFMNLSSPDRNLRFFLVTRPKSDAVFARGSKPRELAKEEKPGALTSFLAAQLVSPSPFAPREPAGRGRHDNGRKKGLNFSPREKEKLPGRERDYANWLHRYSKPPKGAFPALPQKPRKLSHRGL